MTTVLDVELDLYPAESFPLTGAQSVILALFRQRGNFTDSELNDQLRRQLGVSGVAANAVRHPT